MKKPKKSHKWMDCAEAMNDNLGEMDCMNGMPGMEKNPMYHPGMDMGHMCMDDMEEDMPMHHPVHAAMYQGNMPKNTLLAHAYVPWQCYTKAFSPQEALMKGTLFPELYGPYKPPV